MVSSKMLLDSNCVIGVCAFCWVVLMLTKFTLQQATKAQMESRGIARAFFLGGCRGTRTPKHFVNLTGESKNFKFWNSH